MNKVYAKRLLKLADFLDTLPRKRFDYAHYVGDDFEGKQDLSCGTTACALGWATAMPEFRRLGACFVGRGEDARLTIRSDKGAHESDVSRHLFGLTYAEHSEIFVPGGPDYGGGGPPPSATPKQVAKHIRKFVAARTAK